MTAPRFQRTYRSVGEFLADIFFMTKNIRRVRRIMREELISSAFRERLMLAVISVYRCRYCSWAHTREALRSGVARDEIASLLTGSVDSCPEDEAVALLYAQHWADTDTCPDPESCRRLEQAYGAEKAEAINMVLRMIRVGNLTGNTWDRFLNRISFGRWAKTAHLA
jgi:AhpD family alkylhydroperoxidase